VWNFPPRPRPGTPPFLTNIPCSKVPLPAFPCHYTIPGSHLLDPPYSARTPTFPFPRFPWPFETESRRAGTGLLGGPGVPC